MSFTSLVRWRNFTLDNLKTILQIYPDLAEDVSRNLVNDKIERQLDGYKKTSYQFACQLGLEDRSGNNFKVQNYLFSFSDLNLEKYMEFWFKTYYAPNPYIRSNDEPILIYKEIIEHILENEELEMNFTQFCEEKIGQKSSYDILINAILTHGKPIKVKSLDEDKILYIDEAEREKVLADIDVIKQHFEIPENSKDKKVYFDRYSYKNFCVYHDIEGTISGEIISNNETGAMLTEIDKEFNRIIFGAPGTGKSYKLKLESEGDGINPGCFKKQNIKRVTFHSNYSYFQFVGSYKPKPLYKQIEVSENNVTYMTEVIAEDSAEYTSSLDITYEFVPGPFLEVLVKAIVDYENGDSCENYLLIIEEINRANVSGVFGDVFQLLDRDKNGKSEYSIAVSDDMKVYLAKMGIKNPNELYIPSNFYIWCTMNSADQGVYPIDTAFKRRWNFEYIGIDENDDEIDEIKVTIGGYGLCYWNKFRQVINEHLALEHNVKEDKLIGPFFIKKENLEESKFEFAFMNKLLMYLSEDVFKHNRGALFGNNRTLTQIFKSFKDGDKIFDGLDENEFCVKDDTMENEEE